MKCPRVTEIVAVMTIFQNSSLTFMNLIVERLIVEFYYLNITPHLAKRLSQFVNHIMERIKCDDDLYIVTRT